MKIKGFCFGRFLSSSPITHVSAKSLFLSNSPFIFTVQHFGTKSVANREKMKPELGNIRNLDDAFRSYESISRMRPLPNVKQFTQLLSGVVKLKEYSAAIFIFKDIKCNFGALVNEYTMTVAINCYCLSNRVDYGFSILGWFFKRGCVPNVFTFSTLLKGLFRENRINEAQGLFRKMVKEELCELSVVTYGTVIDGLCKAGNTPMAIEFLRVMEKGRTCKPDTNVYNMVIDSLCKDKKIDSALIFFDEMSNKGIPPDVVTYSALICGLCNLSRWSEVKMLIKKTIDCKISPDDALCKEGWVDEAKHVLDIMKQQNVTPDIVSYSALIDGYCLQGRMDEARNVFDSMVSKNVAPDIWSYSILINGYCKKMKIDDAMDIFREMPRKGMKPDVTIYTTILQGLFRGGRFSDALEIFDELQAVGLKPDFYTYSNMLDGLCKNGQVERASLLLDELERREGDHLHINYYNIIMDGLCVAKKLDASRAIFRELASKRLKPDVVTYNIMIKGCFKNGLQEEAKDLLVEMEQASLLPNEVTYNLVVRGFLMRGEYDAAAKFLEEMVAKGFSPSSSVALMLDSLDTKEHGSSILKFIKKWAPSTLNLENGSKNYAH